MHIICDSREQSPYSFTGPRYEGVTVTRGTLQTGDYSLKSLEDLISIERKSVDDLVSTLSAGRERFTRELERSRGFQFFAIVAECTMQDIAEHHYRSQMLPHSVLQSLFAFQIRFGVQVVWAGNRAGGEYAIFSLLGKFLSEHTTRLQKILKAHGEGVTQEDKAA